MIIFSSFVILLLLSPVLIENEEKMTSKKYTPQEIARLILLCWHGEADKQQMTELEEWLEESADNRSFYESLGARSYQGTEWQEYMKIRLPERLETGESSDETEEACSFPVFIAVCCIGTDSDRACLDDKI